MLRMGALAAAPTGDRRPPPLPSPPAGYRPAFSLAVPGPLDHKFNGSWWNAIAGVSLLGFWVAVALLRPDYRRRSKYRILLEWLFAWRLAWKRESWGDTTQRAAHESIHALLLWLFTREKPIVSVKLRDGYASAFAPSWYFPRNAFMLVSVAPAVLLSIAALSLARKAPPWILPAIGFMAAANLGGSSVDLYIARQLSKRSPVCYLHDTGAGFTIWEPDDAATGSGS